MVAASIVRVARELSRRSRRRVVAALLFFAYLSCVFIETRWARTAFDGGGAKHGILPRYANAEAGSGAPRDTHDKAEAWPLLPASSSLGTDKKPREGASSVERSRPPSRAPSLPGSEFAQCMLRLEREVLNQNQIDAWDRDRVTIPTSVKIVGDRYWILGLRYIFRKLHYQCNGVDGAQVLDLKNETRFLFVLQCPSSVSPRNTTLETLSVWKERKNIIRQTYDMTVFDECERKDIEMFKERLPSKVMKPRIGVATLLQRDTAKALQWAAYNHAIGVDHIWMYLNEDWNNATDLPQRDYITWIPWNYRVSNRFRRQSYGGWVRFQAASQTDALWRAKRLGVEWIANIDIDEYIAVRGGKTSGKPLAEYFHALRESLALKRPIASIQLASVPFGLNNSEFKRKEKKRVVIDHVYRKNIHLEDSTFRRRRKHFLNVSHATAINVHYVDDGDNIHREAAGVLRLNHYKSPEKFRVFQGGKNLTKDTLLMDSFHSVIEHEMTPKKIT